MNKKTLLTAISVVLVLAMVVGGTLAYLQDTSGPKENVFQKNVVDVDLTESGNGQYSIIPGMTVTKDPEVTVTTTLPSYVFVEAEITDAAKRLVDYEIDTSWTKLKEGVWYMKLDDAVSGQEYSILKNDQVTYLNTIGNEEMKYDTPEDVKMTFTSYVIQQLKSGVNDQQTNFTPAEAWAVIKGGESAEAPSVATSDVANNAAAGATLTAAAAPSTDSEAKTTVEIPAGATLGDTALTADDTLQILVETESTGMFAVADGNAVATIDVTLYKNGVATDSTSNTLSSGYYTVSTVVSKNLSQPVLSYSGDATEQWTKVESINGANQFTYNPDTGNLVFTTTHFSEFELSSDAVAYIAATDTAYSSLPAAYAAVLENNGGTIDLLKDAIGGGIGSDRDAAITYTVDFHGHTYTCGNPAVGSTGTETQGVRTIYGQNVTLKNGTLACTSDVLMLVHIYGDLTLDNMIVDGTGMGPSGWDSDYTMSACSGVVLIKDSTIKVKANGTAFDVDGAYASRNSRNVSVTVDGNSVINGIVEYVAGRNNNSELIMNGGDVTNATLTVSGNSPIVRVYSGCTYSDGSVWSNYTGPWNW